MTGFLFLRHGETDLNAAGITMGRLDIPLNMRGIRQAHRAAGLLAGAHHAPTRLITSPLQRCTATAEIVARPLALEIATSELLVERDWGVYQGGPKDNRPDPTETPNGGESWERFTARCRSALDLIEGDGSTVLVSHSGVYRGLLYTLGLTAGENGVPLRCENAVPYFFTRLGDAWSVSALDRF